jgi:hypothetical protein
MKCNIQVLISFDLLEISELLRMPTSSLIALIVLSFGMKRCLLSAKEKV